MQKLHEVKFHDYLEVGSGRAIKAYNDNNPDCAKMAAYMNNEMTAVKLCNSGDNSTRFIPIHYVTQFTIDEKAAGASGAGKGDGASVPAPKR